MRLSDILTPDRVRCAVQASSRKRVLEQTSELFARDLPQFTSTEIYDGLLNRERLGSTGLGGGVAIPHARLDAAEATLAAFLQLRQGVDFDAPDGQPVDLVLALVVPVASTQAHLDVLAQIAAMFSKPGLCQSLRAEPDPYKKFQLLTGWTEAD